MKIIIVGGGIAGLTTYLHLRKHLPSLSTHTITIFESHKPRTKLATISSSGNNTTLRLGTPSESTAIMGAGLGISPNGMRVLRDLDLDLDARVVAQGFPAEKFIFKGANGWTLGVQSTSDKAIRGEGEQEEVCIASSRHGLWETIMRYVEEKYGESVVLYRKVLSVERLENKKIEVRCVDDEGKEAVEETDLVLGADGVKGVVREALFGDEEQYKPTYT